MKRLDLWRWWSFWKLSQRSTCNSTAEFRCMWSWRWNSSTNPTTREINCRNSAGEAKKYYKQWNQPSDCPKRLERSVYC